MPPFDIQDGRAVWRNDPGTLPKPNIGQRIVGMAPSWKSQPAPLPNFNPSQPPRLELLNNQLTSNGFRSLPEQQGLLSSFIPAGRMPDGSVPSSASPFAEGQQKIPSPTASSNSPVVDATSLMRIPSRIPRPNVASDVKPNFSLVDEQQGKRLSSLMAGIADEGRTVNLENPLGLNIDPDVSGHLLPDNAGKELIELAKPTRWQKVTDADKAKLVELMGQDMAAANGYAKAVLGGQPRPTAIGAVGGTRTFSREVDDLVHSSAWVDGRLKPEEKATLARLIRANDAEGAADFVRQLYRRFWYEGRYPRWANTLAGRLAQAAKIANAYEHNKQWMVETSKVFAKGTDKCNEFVSDILDQAGLEPPRRRGGWGGPIGAAEWADASRNKIGHWQIVNGPPQPGDVMAEITGHDPRTGALWAHVGVVVGNGRTASASTKVYPPGMVVVNDWGFREDDLGKRVVRRYVP